MAEEPTPRDALPAVKLQFDALLADYRMRTDAVERRRQMQGQLDTMTLAGLGLSITLVLAILERSPTDIGVILLLPILFFAIAFVQLRHERQLHLWCAGCASGEEVYTLSILWRTCVQPDFLGLQLRQVATDVDEHMLERARQARYPASSLKDAPPHWLDTAFDCCEAYVE